MRPTLSLAAGLVLASLGFGSVSATAAPAMPHPGILAGSTVESVVHGPHRHLRYSGRTDKAYRMHRRMNTRMHGNPNARNPQQQGYQQQLGNTTNGTRF